VVDILLSERKVIAAKTGIDIQLKYIADLHFSDQHEISKYLSATERCCEDLSFRKLKDAPFKEIERANSGEYTRRIHSLAKVLIDEYARITR